MVYELYLNKVVFRSYCKVWSILSLPSQTPCNRLGRGSQLHPLQFKLPTVKMWYTRRGVSQHSASHVFESLSMKGRNFWTTGERRVGEVTKEQSPGQLLLQTCTSWRQAFGQIKELFSLEMLTNKEAVLVYTDSRVAPIVAILSPWLYVVPFPEYGQDLTCF